MLCRGASRDCGADVERVVARQIDESTWQLRKGIDMTSADELLNADRCAGNRIRPSGEPSCDSFALRQIPTAQTSFPPGWYVVAVSGEVSVNVAAAPESAGAIYLAAATESAETHRRGRERVGERHQTMSDGDLVFIASANGAVGTWALRPITAACAIASTTVKAGDQRQSVRFPGTDRSADYTHDVLTPIKAAAQ